MVLRLGSEEAGRRRRAEAKKWRSGEVEKR